MGLKWIQQPPESRQFRFFMYPMEKPVSQDESIESRGSEATYSSRRVTNNFPNETSWRALPRANKFRRMWRVIFWHCKIDIKLNLLDTPWPYILSRFSCPSLASPFPRPLQAYRRYLLYVIPCIPRRPRGPAERNARTYYGAGK